MSTVIRSIVLCGLFSIACGGCIAGHVVRNVSNHDPSGAVRWTYRTGSQLVLSYKGPLVCRMTFKGVEPASNDAVIVCEQFGSMGHLPTLPARWALSLETGQLVFFARSLGPQIKTWKGDVAKLAASLKVNRKFYWPAAYRIPGTQSLLLVDHDPVCGLAMGWGDLIMCVDLEKLPASAFQESQRDRDRPSSDDP